MEIRSGPNRWVAGPGGGGRTGSATSEGAKPPTGTGSVAGSGKCTSAFRKYRQSRNGSISANRSGRKTWAAPVQTTPSASRRGRESQYRWVAVGRQSTRTVH